MNVLFDLHPFIPHLKKGNHHYTKNIIFLFLVAVLLTLGCAILSYGQQTYKYDNSIVKPIYDKVNTIANKEEQVAYVQKSLEEIEVKYTKYSTIYYKILELLVYLKSSYGYSVLEAFILKENISNRLFGKKSTESATNRHTIIILKTPLGNQVEDRELKEYIAVLLSDIKIFEEAAQNNNTLNNSVAASLSTISYIYEELHKTDLALDYRKKSIEILEKFKLFNQSTYVTDITGYTTTLTLLERHKEAYSFLSSKKLLFEKEFGSESVQMFNLLKAMNRLMYHLPETPETKDFYDNVLQSVAICEKLYANDEIQIARHHLEAVVNYYLYVNKSISKAEIALNYCYKIFLSNKNTTYEDMIGFWGASAQIYGMLNDTNRAMTCYKKQLQYISKIKSIGVSFKVLQVGIFSRLAFAYESINKDSSDYYFKKNIELSEALYQDHRLTNSMAVTYSSYANTLSNRKDYREADKYYSKQLDFFKKHRPQALQIFDEVKFDYGRFLASWGKKTEGLQYMEEALLGLASLGHHLNRNKYPSLLLLYWDLDKHDKALELLKKYYDGSSQDILENMIGLTDEEQQKVNNTFLGLSSVFLQRLAKKSNTLDDVLAHHLFLKNLSLDYATFIAKNIKQLPITKQNEYIALKKQKVSVIQQNNDIKLDSLLWDIRWKQKLLEHDVVNIIRASGSGQILQNYPLLKQGLQPTEAYISIRTIRTKTDSSVVALILVKDIKDNHLVSINEERIFSPKVDYYQLWRMVEDHIKGKTTIYIEADGWLNRINFSLIKLPNGKRLFEELDIRMVSSARDFLSIKTNNTYKGNTALLVGNPSFSVKAPSTTLVAQNYTKSDVPIYSTETFTRGGIKALPYTQREVENINKILVAKNFKTQLVTAANATEEVVKSAKSPRILHIATHGFFEPDVNLNDTTGQKDYLDMRKAFLKNNPMLRSGILLAGADNYLKTKQLSPNYENGILTAYEVLNNMNLENTELVVLSACDTGLGDIKNGEGIYGLQRAFKIAGAKAILMSLSKVPDEATQVLMTEFYKNWLEKGMEKHKALKEAQLTMKAHPLYSDPSNWGAFILIE